MGSALAGILILGGLCGEFHLSSGTAQKMGRWYQAQMQGKGSFPSLGSVQSAVRQTMGFASVAQANRWVARSRRRAWLPQVDVRLGTDTDVGVRGVRQEDELWTEARGFGVDVVLRWGLDGLVFSGAEVQIYRELRARATMLQRLLQRVTELYMQRLDVEWALSTHSGPAESLMVKAAHLDGLLMALTGGKWWEKRP